MSKQFDHILPHIEDWPIAKQSKEPGEFIKRLNDFVFEQMLTVNENDLAELLQKSISMELQRVKTNPWKVDPVDDEQFWKMMLAELEVANKREDKLEALKKILTRIINRYNTEIVGHFKPNTFLFSRIFLTSLFKRIFGRYFKSGQWRWGTKKNLKDKIKIQGPIEQIRELFEKGTVVVVPTHYSNLDSIMIGYAIDSNVGLPCFSFGAGLNLYNVELVGYFISRLGAFKVDRRKKNPIYLECLKSMTSFSIIEDVNCLFFPGGTRSRSGQTEDKLKLGLLSSVIEAQRVLLGSQSNKKVYVVPLCIGYHFVLEASELVDQHLQNVARDQYKKQRKTGISFSSIFKFIKQIYTKESEVYMSFGEPLDVFGNGVDREGNSIDKHGKPVDVSDYFLLDDHLTVNTQREGIYAKVLAESVVQSFQKHNTILSSNVVSFVSLYLILKDQEAKQIIPLINQKAKKFEIEYSQLLEESGRLIAIIRKMHTENKVNLSEENWGNVPEIIERGISNLGIYHQVVVLKKVSKDKVLCGDLKLLYFYHNRLINYGFEELMGWEKFTY